MAVPQNKVGKARKRKRRTHFKIQAPTMAICPNCGELTLSHQVCKKCGYYKGNLVIEPKAEKETEEEAE